MAEENNIGASRLLGTNGLQQAVDSLTTQVNKLTSAVGTLANNSRGSGGGNNGAQWNANSNRSTYSSNGGGGRFSAGPMSVRGNGGGASFGAVGPGTRLSAGLGAVAGIASSLAQYGNQNMSGMFQMNYYAQNSAMLGGAGSNVNQIQRQLFSNNYGALNVNDAAQAGYILRYAAGNSQFNGQSNRSFSSALNQSGAFAYVSPTMGQTAAATAYQQSYTARSYLMSQALGLAPTILPGGQKNTMGAIAQSIYQRTFGNQQINARQLSAATSQGGSLNVNLQYFGQQLGWNQSTIQEYQDYISGMVTAQNRGISNSQYDKLTQQAFKGNPQAQAKLRSIGVGASAFEAQRNLNSTRMSRQEDINESMSKAFTDATNVVNQFSQALTNLLKSTGLDKAIGTGAGWSSAVSNSLSGFSGAFGAVGGALGAARLFGFGGGSSAASAARLGTYANGAYNITSVGGAAGTGFIARALPVVGSVALAAGVGSTTDKTIRNHVNKKGAQTSDFMSWLNSHKWKTKQQETAVANQFFQQYPDAQVDPGFLKFMLGPGYKPPVTTGVGGGGSSGTPGNTPGNGASNLGASAAQIIGYAETQLNVPYVYGGESPGRGFDCSGLIQWAYGKAGVKIPRVAADQQKAAKQVPLNQTQPGDLLFVGNPAHHVVMAIGGGKVIEAPHTGDHVKIRPLNPNEYTSAGRFINNIGNMNSITNGASDSNNNTLSTSQSRSGGDIGSFGGTSELAAIMAALAGGNAGGAMPLSSSSNNLNTTGGSSKALGSAPKGNGNNSKSALQAYAKQLLASRGWGNEWGSFNALVMSESGWDVHATNPQSGAYGIPQSLPGSKMASAGSDWRTNGDTQLQWMMGYIADRYGDPNKAWSFHQKNNWYAAGAWSIDKDQTATVHQGEMIIPAQQAETIRQTLLNNSFNPNVSKNAGSGSISFGDINIVMPSDYTGTPAQAKQAGKMIIDTILADKRIKELQIGQ